jgi:hypothetical protein
LTIWFEHFVLDKVPEDLHETAVELFNENWSLWFKAFSSLEGEFALERSRTRLLIMAQIMTQILQKGRPITETHFGRTKTREEIETHEMVQDGSLWQKYGLRQGPPDPPQEGGPMVPLGGGQ